VAPTFGPHRADAGVAAVALEELAPMPMQTAAPRQGWRRLTYHAEPDFTRPLWEVSAAGRDRLLGRLQLLYGDAVARRTLPGLIRLLRVHMAHKTGELLEAEQGFDLRERFSEKDMMLITYGDMVRARGRTGLAALGEFLAAFRRGGPVFSILHVLPFFPYTSDRGFSVVDFREVDARLGSWNDIRRLGETFRLMFDGVLNHASASSLPFREMLRGNPEFKNFAVSFGSPDELSDEQRRLLRRPRTTDVLTLYQSLDGPRWLWTTFSRDQIDLNYRNPRVLLAAVDTLLFYVRMGADLIRLDAIPYLWKELGTSSANLTQTHAIVKLFRDVLDLVSPQAILATESNVPHQENIAYFGQGDEAQLVYNFALPPLVLHAFYREDATWLSAWASELQYPEAGATYLNMLDTHDGIGLPGVQQILPPDEIDFLVKMARQHGAFISYRSDALGEVPYEINTTWYSALNYENSSEPRALQVQRFVASRSVALALRGVPAVYLHSLAGSRNDIRQALQTNVKRDVNRSTLDFEILQRNLADPQSKLYMLSENLRRLFRTRGLTPSFHPNGPQRVLPISPSLFVLLRTSPSGDEHVLCLTNVTSRPQSVAVSQTDLGVEAAYWFDLVAGRGWMAPGGTLRLELGPYEVLWLTPSEELERRIESAV
jgi:sucrose phosphorylase